MFSTRVLSKTSRLQNNAILKIRPLQRGYMSTMPMSDAAEEQAHFLLMLGKPGGGKGTISKKILKVRKKKDERKHS